MFERKYLLRVYHEGQSAPTLEFVVEAVSVTLHGHKVNADGTWLIFTENQYITIDLMG